MKSTVLTYLLILIIGLSAYAIANPAPSISLDSVRIDRDVLHPRDFRRPDTFLPRQIGLALSGGGARGIAQIGVLKAFDEAGLDISFIAGSSMGSIIGGLYASGYRAEEIEATVRKVDFSSLFSDSPPRSSLFLTQREERERYLLSIRFDGIKPYIPRALTAGQRLTSLLTDLTIRSNYSSNSDFDDLSIPFRAVATDIADGHEVIIQNGSLADAMRASMAFPLAFTPVEINGRYLVDGGIVDPLPVHVCRRMGADYVVAVNTASTLLPAENIDNPIDIANQVTTIMSQQALADQLRLADYIITPLLNSVKSFKFEMNDTLVATGYEAGKRAAADIINRLSNAPDTGPITIAEVTPIRANSLLTDLCTRFPLTAGQSCSPETVHKALAYADRDMQFVHLSAWFDESGDGTVIRIDGIPNHPARDITYEFSGNTVIPDSIMISHFPTQSAEPLSLWKVKMAADSIIALMRRGGYDLAHLQSIRYDHDAKKVIVTMNEGILSYVDIRGNDRTRSWIIKANYPLRPGEPFDVRKSETGLANIYGTGFFESVGLDIEPTDHGVHLTINVKEKKFTELRFGGHWDDEYQSEMFSELLDDNVLGAGFQTLAHARLSSRRNQFYLQFKADRLSKTLITASTRFYFSRLRRRLFQTDDAPMGFRVEDRFGWSILIGRQIARLGAIDFSYRIEDITTRLTITDEETDNILSAFKISSTVETFNKFPYPDYGHRQDISLEFTGRWLGGTYDEYTKMSGEIEAYAPLGKYINFNPRIAVGISTANLPDIEKFYIGGLYDFSGYRTDRLAGDKFFVTNLRLRFKLPYKIYLIGMVDYGNVFGEYEEIKLEDFLTGWGAALSINTPVGPIDFGYGKAEETPDRLYLNVGLKF